MPEELGQNSDQSTCGAGNTGSKRFPSGSEHDVVEISGRQPPAVLFPEPTSLTGKLAYIAGPIDDSKANLQDLDVLAMAADRLFGVSSFRPARAWLSSKSNVEASRKVLYGNHAVLRRCDVVLAVLNQTMCYGTWRDIQVAVEDAIPVFIWDCRPEGWGNMHLAFSDVEVSTRGLTADEFIKWANERLSF